MLARHGYGVLLFDRRGEVASETTELFSDPSGGRARSRLARCA
jgi:hypothetical protein